MAICYRSLDKTAAARLTMHVRCDDLSRNAFGVNTGDRLEAILDLESVLAHASSDSHDVPIRLRHHSAESGGGASAKHAAECAISAVSDTESGPLGIGFQDGEAIPSADLPTPL